MKPPKTFLKIVYLLCCVIVCACKSNINLNLPSYQSQIVVEGYIENGLAPVVQLTKSVPYFQPYTLDSFYNSYVHNAVVIVSDGTTKDTLEEFNPTPYLTGALKDSLRFYTYTDFNLVKPKIKGEVGKTYTLDIYVLGKHLSSSTIIHSIPKVDSFGAAIPPGATDTTRREVFINIQDPSTTGDYYEFFDCKNIHLTGVAPLDDYYLYTQYAKRTGTFNDDFVNGEVIPFQAFGSYHKKDTAYIKFCHIDQAQSDYKTTVQLSSGSQGSPFSTPSYIKSNITGGIGIWGGVSAVYFKVIFKK